MQIRVLKDARKVYGCCGCETIRAIVGKLAKASAQIYSLVEIAQTKRPRTSYVAAPRTGAVTTAPIGRRLLSLFAVDLLARDFTVKY